MHDRYLKTIHAIDMAHRALMALLQTELVKRLDLPGLTSGQALMLAHLDRHEMRASDLQDIGGEVAQNLYTNIQKLVDLGLVERKLDIHDKRVNLLKATPAGLEAADKFLAAIDRHQASMITDGWLTSEEADKTLTYLEKLDRYWRTLIQPPCYREKPPALEADLRLTTTSN